jgi:putative Mg2+ transporter-C (MgtC) family protein
VPRGPASQAAATPLLPAFLHAGSVRRARGQWYNARMVFPVDWPSAWHDVSRLLIAYGLALPVGWYREQEAHSIGVRTFPLVAMASCGYVMLASPAYHNTVDAQSRVIQGLVAGIGFIGGGAILKAQGNVHGTATAASIWNTGVVGAAVAQDRFVMAAALALMNLFALRVLLPLKMKLDEREEQKKKAPGPDPM